jgi:hypothetical protein
MAVNIEEEKKQVYSRVHLVLLNAHLPIENKFSMRRSK